MNSVDAVKWCSYCAVHGHTLEECWRTRPVNWPYDHSRGVEPTWEGTTTGRTSSKTPNITEKTRDPK